MDNIEFQRIIGNRSNSFTARLHELLLARHPDIAESRAMDEQAKATLIPHSTYYAKVKDNRPFNIHQVISLAKHFRLDASQTHKLLSEHQESFKFNKVTDYKIGLKKLMLYLGSTPKSVGRSLGLEKDINSWLDMESARIPYIDLMAILEIGLKVRVDPKIWKYTRPLVQKICEAHKKTVKWGKEEGSYNFDLLQAEFDEAAKTTLENPIASSIKEARLGTKCTKHLGVSTAALSDGLARNGDKYIDACKFLKIRETLGYKLQPGQKKKDMDAALAQAMNEYRITYQIDTQASAPALISAIGKMIGCTDEAMGQIMGHTKASAGVMMIRHKADGYIADSTRLGAAISFIQKAHDAMKERHGISCLSQKDINRIDKLNEEALKAGGIQEVSPASKPDRRRAAINFQHMNRTQEAQLARI